MFAGDFIRATPAASMLNDITTAANLTSQVSGSGAVNVPPVVGIVFTAPPSGQVSISFSADMSVASALLIVGVRIRTGNTIGSGVVVDGGEPGDGPNSLARIICDSDRSGTGRTILVQSLAAGDVYNLSMYYYVTAAVAGTIFARNMVVVPIL